MALWHSDTVALWQLLVRNQFPHIAALCAERGVSFVEVDLRTGVTKQQSEDSKVPLPPLSPFATLAGATAVSCFSVWFGSHEHEARWVVSAPIDLPRGSGNGHLRLHGAARGPRGR